MEYGLDRNQLALVHTHCIMGSSSHALFTFKDLPSYSELIKLLFRRAMLSLRNTLALRCVKPVHSNRPYIVLPLSLPITLPLCCVWCQCAV